MNKLVLVLRIATAIILLQTLFFKFSGAPESVYIFTTLGAEPFGRWFAGLSELVASILLLVPATQVLGALLTLAIMSGAILSHLAVLGIVVQNDGGLLFGMAILVFLMAAVIVYLKRGELKNLPLVGKFIP